MGTVYDFLFRMNRQIQSNPDKVLDHKDAFGVLDLTFLYGFPVKKEGNDWNDYSYVAFDRDVENLSSAPEMLRVKSSQLPDEYKKIFYEFSEGKKNKDLLVFIGKS